MEQSNEKSEKIENPSSVLNPRHTESSGVSNKKYEKLWISKNVETVKQFQKIAPVQGYKISRAYIIEGQNHLQEALLSTFIRWQNDSKTLKNLFQKLNSKEYKLLKLRKNQIQTKLDTPNKNKTLKKTTENFKDLKKIQSEKTIKKESESELLDKPSNNPKTVPVLNLNYGKSEHVESSKLNIPAKNAVHEKNIEENSSLQKRRHMEVKLSEEYKLVKMHKIMSFTESNFHALCSTTCKRNDKLKSIFKYIEELKKTELNWYKNPKSNVLCSYLRKDSQTSLSVAASNLKPNEMTKIIQLNGAVNTNFICKFRYSYKLFMNINMNIITQMLEKRSLFRICNSRHHCRIIFRLNDFILCEEDKRLSQIIVESSSKLELILVLDEMNRSFPSWGVWRNGTLCN